MHIKAIFPLLFGSRQPDPNSTNEVIGNLFSEGVLSLISTEIQIATLKSAAASIRRLGLEHLLTVDFFEQTVKGIIDGVCRLKGLITWGDTHGQPRMTLMRDIAVAVNEIVLANVSKLQDSSKPLAPGVESAIPGRVATSVATGLQLEGGDIATWLQTVFGAFGTPSLIDMATWAFADHGFCEVEGILQSRSDNSLTYEDMQAFLREAGLKVGHITKIKNALMAIENLSP